MRIFLSCKRNGDNVPVAIHHSQKISSVCLHGRNGIRNNLTTIGHYFLRHVFTCRIGSGRKSKAYVFHTYTSTDASVADNIQDCARISFGQNMKLR